MTYAQLSTVEMKVECQFELWKFTRKTSYDMTWLHKEAVTTLKQVKHMCVSESDVCPSLEEKANITAHCNGCETSVLTVTVFPCFFPIDWLNNFRFLTPVDGGFRYFFKNFTLYPGKRIQYLTNGLVQQPIRPIRWWLPGWFVSGGFPQPGRRNSLRGRRAKGVFHDRCMNDWKKMLEQL